MADPPLTLGGTVPWKMQRKVLISLDLRLNESAKSARLGQLRPVLGASSRRCKVADRNVRIESRERNDCSDYHGNATTRGSTRPMRFFNRFEWPIPHSPWEGLSLGKCNGKF